MAQPFSPKQRDAIRERLKESARKMLSGSNSHHMIEGMFKAFAKALDMATTQDPRITDVLSTKGTL